MKGVTSPSFQFDPPPTIEDSKGTELVLPLDGKLVGLVEGSVVETHGSFGSQGFGAQDKRRASKPEGPEDGHGDDKKPDPATVKYEQDVAARKSIIEQNAQLDRENAPIQEKIDFYSAMKQAMTKVCSHNGIAGDGYISKQELIDLARVSSDPGQRDACNFLLANWDQVESPKYDAWGGGLNVSEMVENAAKLGNRIQALEKQKKLLLSVPPEPVPPGSTTGSSGSTGSESTGGTGSTGGPGASPAPATPTQSEWEAKALSNFNTVPAFSSQATTGEGRMQDGMNHLQTSMDALEKDLTAAAAKGDQAAMTLINSKMARLQAGFSMLMQMIKQRQEMESNVAKMFSDMAKSAIQNMR